MDMVSLFQHYPNYYHMVNSNKKLKLNEMPHDVIAALGAPEIHRRFLPETNIRILCGSPASRQSCGCPLALDNCLVDLRQFLDAEQTTGGELVPAHAGPEAIGSRNLLANGLLMNEQQQPGEQGQRQANLALGLALEAPKTGPGSAVQPQLMLTKLKQIDPQTWLLRFINSLEILENLLMSIAPIRYLSTAFNFLSSIFEYFSIRIVNLFTNGLMPRLRYYVINPLIDRVSHRLLALYDYLNHDTAANTALIPRADANRDVIMYIISSPCQTCVNLCAGQYPSMADALPAETIGSRERFFMEYPMRQLMRLNA